MDWQSSLSMKALKPSSIQLRFVHLDLLVLHEEEDPFRVRRLIRSITNDGKLCNPPIVVEFGNQYMVLDGATRVSALRQMGIRDVLVQIVDYFSDMVSLSTWHHVVVGIPSHRLFSGLEELRDSQNLSIRPIEARTCLEKLATREILALILPIDGKRYAVDWQGDVNRRATHLRELVSVYRGKAEVHRTIEIDLPSLAQQYPDLTAVLAFPTFEPRELLEIASSDNKVPMGVTRHIIFGRALGLGVPLSMLTDEQPLAEKNAWLEGQIQQRLRANKVRLYQEPVFVFDD